MPWLTTQLDVHIKSVAQAVLSAYDAAEEVEAKPAEAEAEVEADVETKAEPVEETTPVKQVNGDAAVKVNGVTPAAEAPAEEAQSPLNDESLSASQEWVSVAPPSEAETASPAEPTPAPTQSWADDHPDPTPEVGF